MSTCEVFQRIERRSVTDASCKTTITYEAVALAADEITREKRRHRSALASLKPDKTRPLARNGKSVLDATPEVSKKTAHIVVRIYYVSEGDELLCTDSAPMTPQAADALKNLLAPIASGRVVKAKATLAVRVESYGKHEPRVAWKGARVVVFPSTLAPFDDASACARLTA